MDFRPPDWRPEIARHAEAAGIDLPPTTIDELALHLDDLYAAARADGATEAAARAHAIRALDESPWSMLDRHASRDPRRPYQRAADEAARTALGRSFNVFSAIRTALRQFRQHPSFALVTVLVLGLGTGAATTVFTVVDAVVLQPLPYAAPDRLVTLWDTNVEKGLAHDPISPVNFMDYRALPVFKDAAAWWRPGVNLVDPGMDPVRVNTIEVGGNVFEVLGVRPQVGAGFPANGPMFSNELVAVISDRLWRTRYSADPSIVGRQLALNDTPYLIVGVMPPKFHYPDDVDVWQRLRWDLTQHSRAAHFMEAVARLSDGTTFEQAHSAVDGLGLRLQNEYARTNKGWASRLVPLLDEQLGYYRPALMVLFGAVGLLLVIGCLNVASLLLTRALSRDREIAVRIAMGASPRQLVTQLLAESLVLSIAGAGVGVLAAAAALPLILGLTPVDIPRLDEASVDVRALGLGVVVVLVTTLFFGLVPALLLLKTQLTTELKSGERGSSRGARRIYSVLVAGEVALACALLVSSALLIRTVSSMMETPTGVQADDVLTTTVKLTVNVAPQQAPAQFRAAWREASDTHARIIEEIRQQPAVVAAGHANFLPLEVGWRNPFLVQGQPPPARPEDAPQAQMHSISEGYLEAMGATIAEGRALTTFDNADNAGVVVVNESFATRYLTQSRAVGQILRIHATGIGPLGLNLKASGPRVPEGMPFEVVGVVSDIRNVPLGQVIEPAIYFSTRQFPFSEVFLAVKATDRNAAITAVREGLRRAAPNVPMAAVQTWGERYAKRTAEPRLLMTILVCFGILAALLAAIGVYGLFSWSVALRTRELAIRLTLGARPASVGSLVVRQSAMLVVAGLVVGVAMIRVAQGALARVVYGVSPSDVGSTVAAMAVLLAAALIACIPPALRAMRVDPVEGLRAE